MDRVFSDLNPADTSIVVLYVVFLLSSSLCLLLVMKSSNIIERESGNVAFR